jgi:GTP-binding protein
MAWDADTGEFLGELLEHGAKLVVAKGGRGGDGNVKFASPTNRIPQQSQPGQPGQERIVTLEFAVPAEVALIGLPNSGKSTFLQALTNARSESAEYEFTTRDPYIGVCEATPYTRFSILDLPALCAGSSQGQGLGNWFLRHLHRAKALVFVLDSTNETVLPEQLEILENELAVSDIDTSGMEKIIVVNVKTLLDKEQKKHIENFTMPYEVLLLSKSGQAAEITARLAALLGLA